MSLSKRAGVENEYRNRFVAVACLLLLPLCAQAGARASVQPSEIFDSPPRLSSIPSNPGATWMEAVQANPRAHGISGWKPKLPLDSTFMVYELSFSNNYPIFAENAAKAAPQAKRTWVAPRVTQTLTLELWKRSATGDLKEEAPWVVGGALTWTSANFIVDCGERPYVLRVHLDTYDARTNKRLHRRLDNEVLQPDFGLWKETCAD